MRKLVYLFLAFICAIPFYGSLLGTSEKGEQQNADDKNKDTAAAKYDTPVVKYYDELDKKVYGDFDGDGAKEFAYLSYPALYHANGERIELNDSNGQSRYDDDQYYFYFDFYPKIPTTFIRFSKETIPAIRMDTTIWGFLQNLSDLNGDGRDEIGYYHGWYYSNFRDYYSWRFDGKKWRTLIEPFLMHMDLFEASGYKCPIHRVNNQKARIRYTDIDTTIPDMKWVKKVVRLH